MRSVALMLAAAMAFAAMAMTAAELQAQQPGAAAAQPVAPAAGSSQSKVTYDKSLAPDGKPWSGVSLIRYWKSKMPDPTLNFTMVERLELKASEAKKLQWRDGQSGAAEQQNMIDRPPALPQVPPKLTAKEAAKLRRERQIAERKAKAGKGPKTSPVHAKNAKAESTLIYSETPARESLLDRISQQFKIAPDRAIIDFAGNRKNACASKLSKSCEKYFFDPAAYSDDEKAQRLYWTDAVEIIDFRGNENAAKAYEEAFNKTIKLPCFRCYAVTISGDSIWAMQPFFIMRGGDNVAVYKNGALQPVKMEGYKGFEVAGKP